MSRLDEELQSLQEELTSKQASVREQAAQRLAALGQLAADAVPLLARALTDPVVEVRQTVATALAEIGPEARSATVALMRGLSDADDCVRRRCALALAEIGPDARPAVAMLVRQMQSGVTLSERRHAAAALGAIGPGAATAIGPLIELLAESDQRFRAVVAASLLRLCPRAVPRLIEALGHPSPLIRAGAARLIARAGAVSEAHMLLCEMLGDPEEAPREAARQALGR